MYIDLGRIRIYPGVPAMALAAFAANTSSGVIYISVLSTVLMHEGIHIIFLLLCGCTGITLRIKAGGIKLSAQGFSSLSYKKTILCTLSAPVFNLLLFSILSLSDSFPVLSSVNLLIGIMNLVPLPFLDGGRAASALIYQRLSAAEGDRIMNIISVLSLIFLCGLFLVFLLRRKNFYFLIFFIIYCFAEFISDKTCPAFT